jgi:hypothetical protein
MWSHLQKITMVLFITVCMGCASTQSLQPGLGEVFSLQSNNYSDVWNASIRAIDENFSIESADKEKGYIRARKFPNLKNTWGDIVAVFITPVKELSGTYSVEIVSKPASTLPMVASVNWISELWDDIRKNHKEIHSSKPKLHD